MIQLIKTTVREEFERNNVGKAEMPIRPNEEQSNIKNVDDNTTELKALKIAYDTLQLLGTRLSTKKNFFLNGERKAKGVHNENPNQSTERVEQVAMEN